MGRIIVLTSWSSWGPGGWCDWRVIFRELRVLIKVNFDAKELKFEYAHGIHTSATAAS